jgi:hypothetical protein
MVHMLAIDRCDRCQAQALVSVSNTPNHVPALWFCGHHFNDAWAQLMLQGWDVVEDDRYALELQELASFGEAHA